LLQEAKMSRQRTAFQNLKSIAMAGFGGLGISILLVRLDGPAAWLSNLLGNAACEGLKLLPYLLPAVWRALQAYAFDGQPSSPCPLQLLVSLWPLLRVMGGAM
jgi:hypothetical protein